MGYDAPFAGLKVVDLAQGVAGPYCGMLMAQHGANVIKVEPTGDGDWSRTISKRYGAHTAFSIPTNLGKRSVALDLKSERGKDVLWRLIEGADVLLEGFRPGVLARLGFGYDAVAAREPRILYLSVSGFGQTGPLAGRPAMDPVLQAFTGLMVDNKGEDGLPHRVPFPMIDMSTGLYAFQALSAALYARLKESRGRHIPVSLLEAANAMQVIRSITLALEGDKVRRAMPSGVFRTADGWLQFLVVREAQWIAFCTVIGQPELAHEPRFANADARVANEAELLAHVRPLIAAQPTTYWLGRLTAADIMHERLNSHATFREQPQVKAIDLIAWLNVPGLPAAVPVPNIAGIAPFVDGTRLGTLPLVGQHTWEILGEHGFSRDEIASLIDAKVADAPAAA
jgi:crotonobetainyl-CoA:carnitine CoA-transferase CaiB-like acyl-CoA transferase